MRNECTLWLICSLRKCTRAVGLYVWQILTIYQYWRKLGCSSLGLSVKARFCFASFNVLQSLSSHSVSNLSLISYQLRFFVSLCFSFLLIRRLPSNTPDPCRFCAVQTSLPIPINLRWGLSQKGWQPQSTAPKDLALYCRVSVVLEVVCLVVGLWEAT